MRIEETMLTKSLSAVAKDPYGASLAMMRRLSGSGKIIEKTNEFSTDGPFHRSDVAFDIIQHVDRYSTITVSCALTGENGRRQSLRGDVTGTFTTDIREEGFFTETFVAFYLEHIYPIVRRRAEEKLRALAKLSEELIAAPPA